MAVCHIHPQYKSDRCRDTQMKLPSYNSNHIREIANKLCNTGPQTCSKTNNLFTDMTDFHGSECGGVDNEFCAVGKSYTSSKEKPYYALCVL